MGWQMVNARLCKTETLRGLLQHPYSLKNTSPSLMRYLKIGTKGEESGTKT